MRQITWRLLPFLMFCYFVSYLDRVNVGFAALQMVKDLHMSPKVFGFGGGIFFVSYFLFEVPSNLLLEKIGARIWIARIMITWGFLAAGTAFVVGPRSFYTMRLLLGAAEAGFFPGVILYLTYWFPREYRARIVGMVHGRDSRFQFSGFADFRRVARRGWVARASRLAVDVHDGRRPGRAAGIVLPVRPERQAVERALARRRSKIVAQRQAAVGRRRGASASGKSACGACSGTNTF